MVSFARHCQSATLNNRVGIDLRMAAGSQVAPAETPVVIWYLAVVLLE
jgi:hypothetical protein